MADGDAQNTFWPLEYTDVYAAISWDRLHAYHSGLFRKHILKEFLLILEAPSTGSGPARRALSTTFERKYVSSFLHCRLVMTVTIFWQSAGHASMA
jgi:hypothetical protein